MLRMNGQEIGISMKKDGKMLKKNFKIKMFFKKKKKLRLHTTIIRSTFMYGYETYTSTDDTARKL